MPSNASRALAICDHRRVRTVGKVLDALKRHMYGGGPEIMSWTGASMILSRLPGVSTLAFGTSSRQDTFRKGCAGFRSPSKLE